MQVSVNGQPREVREGCTVRDLLDELDIRAQFCAVERNKQLVPRTRHAECVLEPEDELEIVTLVGGG